MKALSLSSFPASSLSGTDGLCAGHSKSLTSKGSGAAANNLKYALADICSHILSGKIPESIRPAFYVASLYALNRKRRGVRPLAVGA